MDYTVLYTSMCKQITDIKVNLTFEILLSKNKQKRKVGS